MKDTKVRGKFIELRAQGLSYINIAKKLKVSKQTLINWGKEFREEILNAKALELEVLYEKYYLSKAKRIEMLGKSLEKAFEELDKRDYTDVPTDKLSTPIMKLLTAIASEIVTPNIRTDEEIQDDKAQRKHMAELLRRMNPKS